MTAERLIVRAPNWLGDAVMALPALAAVRRHAPGVVILAAPSSVAPLFEERTEGAPDEILTVDPHREVEQLRGSRADGILLLPNSFGSAWVASRSGIRERWGYRALARGWLLTKSVPRPRGAVHQARYYLELVRRLGYEAPDTPARIDALPATVERATSLLRDAGVHPDEPLVGFAPGAAYGHAKRWSPGRVANVIQALAASHRARSVLVGAADDRDTGRAIESLLPSSVRVVNLIGRTSLRMLVGVLACCDAFVSNDSGAMHVAAALGVPLTAIFGPTDERVTSPAGPRQADVLLRDVFCRPCMLRECPIDHRCMKRIAAQDVIASVAQHLQAARGPAKPA